MPKIAKKKNQALLFNVDFLLEPFRFKNINIDRNKKLV